MSNMMDDPLHYIGDMPAPSGGGDIWGEDGDVDVELLADALFDNGGDFGMDAVAQQIVNEERDVMFAPLPLGTGQQQQQQRRQPQQDPIQVVTPPSTSPLFVMGGTPAGNLIPDTSASHPPLSFHPSSSSVVTTSSAGSCSFGNVLPSMPSLPTNMNVNSNNISQIMSLMAAAAAANGNTTPAMDPQQQAFMFATNGQVGGQPVAMIPNPFLAMAAGLPSLDRAEFLQAAFLSRQKGRRTMTAEQAERRRERNRQLAKKTRDKKKDYMGSLQDEILELQRQNAELKAMVRSELDQTHSLKVLESCDAIDKVPETVWEACGTDKDMLAAEDFDMVKSIQKSQTAFVITDPSLDDNPIVFCSPDFLAVTGYTREQVIGRNCRFLQGQATCPNKVAQIRKSLAAGEDVGITLINYKADGTPFWNRLFIAAVRDVNDQIVNYMGVVVQVGRPDPGDPEHDVELPK